MHNNYCFNKVLKISPVEVRVWKPPSVSRPVCCRCWRRSSCVAPAPQTPGDWAEPWLSRSGRSARWVPWSGSDGWSRGWRNPRNTQPTPEQEKSRHVNATAVKYYSFKTLPLFSKLYTQIQESHTKCKMPHISCKMKHCIQNITNTSQKQTFANTFAIILIPVRFVCVT